MGRDSQDPTDTHEVGDTFRPPWRLATSYADHMRDLPARESGMVVLDRTPIKWKTVRAWGEDSVIVRFHASPLVTGHLVPAKGWILLFAPLSWKGDHIFNGQEMQPGDVSLITSRYGYVTTGRDRQVLGIGLRSGRLKQVMAALSGQFEGRVPLSDCTLKLGDEAGAAFRHEVLQVQREAFATPCAPGSFLISPANEALLFEHAASTLLRLHPVPVLIKDHLTSDFEVVSAARDAAFANPNNAKLADLCVAAKVGQTRLYESFMSIHGISPGKYLHELRLTRAYESLSDSNNPAPSVKHAALSNGFTHGGRFASEYSQLFGEHPSSTLKRTLKVRKQ